MRQIPKMQKMNHTNILDERHHLSTTVSRYLIDKQQTTTKPKIHNREIFAIFIATFSKSKEISRVFFPRCLLSLLFHLFG